MNMKQQLTIATIKQQSLKSCSIYLDQDPNIYIYTYLVYSDDDNIIICHGVMGGFHRYIKVSLKTF